MATVTVYDLDNYPDNSKTITINIVSVVSTGGEGDEIWVVSASTSGYSDITNRTAIQDLYIRDIKTGWIKSSGLVGSAGKFTIDAEGQTLGVSIDGSSTYYVVLDTGINLSGENVASDLEAKIRALPDSDSWNISDVGKTLSFKNAVVEFKNNKFYIVSGSMGQYYSGSSKTSVDVTISGTDTAYADLGFNLSLSSEDMAGISIKEVLVSNNYTTNTTPLLINTGTDASEGDAFYITDGINYDYFTALSGTTGSSIVVATTGINSYTGIKHSYTAGVTKIQKLSYTDSDMVPTPYYTDVDSIVRFSIKSIVNQLDFSA